MNCSWKLISASSWRWERHCLAGTAGTSYYQALNLFPLLFFLTCLHIHYNCDRCLVQLSSGAKICFPEPTTSLTSLTTILLQNTAIAAPVWLYVHRSLWDFPGMQTVYQRFDPLSYSRKSLLLPKAAPHSVMLLLSLSFPLLCHAGGTLRTGAPKEF